MGGWVGGLEQGRQVAGCLLWMLPGDQLSEARHACHVWEPGGQHNECEAAGLRGAGEARAWEGTCLPACLLCCCLQMCEDLEDDDSLQTLFTIFKQSERLLPLWLLVGSLWPFVDGAAGGGCAAAVCGLQVSIH